MPVAPLPPPGYSPQRSLRSLGGETARSAHWGEKWPPSPVRGTPPGLATLVREKPARSVE